MHNVPDRDHMDRFEGYKEALTKHGLPFQAGLVFKNRVTPAGGATVMKLIMSMPNRPTAICFADPLLGVGAAKEAHGMGVRIPEDLSIVGFDDTDVRYGVHPTLTAVCQDAGVLGYEAAFWLTRSVTGLDRGSFQKTVPTSFEVNESTGPPPISTIEPNRRDTEPGRIDQWATGAVGPAAELTGPAGHGTGESS